MFKGNWWLPFSIAWQKQNAPRPIRFDSPTYLYVILLFFINQSNNINIIESILNPFIHFLFYITQLQMLYKLVCVFNIFSCQFFKKIYPLKHLQESILILNRMNFCFQKTTIDADLIIDNSQKCQNGNFPVQTSDGQFQENCTTLKIPSSIVRVSSLSKISDSNKKITYSTQNQINSLQNPKTYKQPLEKSNQRLNQATKIISDPNAKSAIVNKLLQKGQFQNKQVQPKANKQNSRNQKQKQNLLIPKDIVYHKHQNAQKLIKIYKQKEEKELKECTFNPKINFQFSARSHIDTKQFYVEQIEYCKRTQDKVQQLRLMIQAEKEKENTFRPQLSEQTRQMTQRRANHNVYERLYNQTREQIYDKENELNCAQENINRNYSKKSVPLISNSREKNINFKQRNPRQNSNNQCEMKSSELKRQKSLRTFAEMLANNNTQPLGLAGTIGKQKSNNPLAKRRNTVQERKKSQYSEKKNEEFFGYQPINCRELIKQKQQQQAKNLSRDQSCNLVSSFSKQFVRKESRQCARKDKSNSVKAKTSQKNEKIALQKFVKQFFTVIFRLTLSKQINFNEMLSILTEMNFIENIQDFYEAKASTELKSKVFEIWSILQGDQADHVLLLNLLKILCAIQGYNIGQMFDQVIKKIAEHFRFPDISNLIDGKILVLSEKDSKAIKKDFTSFYLTRFKLGESKIFAKQVNGQVYSFRPSISQESKELAQKYRERIIIESEKLISEGVIDFVIPQNGVIDHPNLLILDNKIKAYKLEQMRKQTERQRRREQDQSMTRHQTSRRSIHQTSFTDKNKYGTRDDLSSNLFSRISHNDNSDSYSRSKDQIFVELYQNGRKSRSNLRDKSTEQIQYEESQNQLTFTPKINQIVSAKQLNQEVNPHDYIPNFTKEVMRMRKSKNPREDMSISPLLYLNVTMQGNSQTKIPIFQTDNIHTITEKVRIMMKIENGQQERQKLKAILKKQIIPVLDQLGIKQGQQQFLFQQ